MSRKPRSDSKLKTLSDERQASVAAYARDHSLPATVEWLKDDGLETSAGALSQFLSWYALRQQLLRNEGTVQTLLDNFKQAVPEASPEKVQQVGQAFFSALALEQRDAKAWFLTQQVGLKKEALALEREKFRRETCELFLKWNAEKQARDIAASPSTNADKIEKLGQLMFGEDWKPQS